MVEPAEQRLGLPAAPLRSGPPTRRSVVGSQFRPHRMRLDGRSLRKVFLIAPHECCTPGNMSAAHMTFRVRGIASPTASLIGRRINCLNFRSLHIAFLEDETSPKNKVPVFAVQQKRIIYGSLSND